MELEYQDSLEYFEEVEQDYENEYEEDGTIHYGRKMILKGTPLPGCTGVKLQGQPYRTFSNGVLFVHLS
jgi:hypothetical protein